MQGTQVIYLGRSVAKEGFRAFVYGAQSRCKLVESWDEFEAAMASGIWFASQDEVIEPKVSNLLDAVEKEDVPKKRGK